MVKQTKKSKVQMQKMIDEAFKKHLLAKRMDGGSFLSDIGSIFGLGYSGSGMSGAGMSGGNIFSSIANILGLGYDEKMEGGSFFSDFIDGFKKGIGLFVI